MPTETKPHELKRRIMTAMTRPVNTKPIAKETADQKKHTSSSVSPPEGVAVDVTLDGVDVVGTSLAVVRGADDDFVSDVAAAAAETNARLASWNFNG